MVTVNLREDSLTALLQALYHTPLFRDQVVSHTCNLPRQRVLASLQQVFLFLRYSKRNIFSPSEFLRLARPPWLEAGRQQDCSEFLTHLLDTLNESTSITRKVFGSKMRTSTECNNCRGLKVTDWDTADFQLSLPDPEFNILSDLIHNYFEPQHLTGDNKYFCVNCDNHTEADQTVTVVSAPECLLITMKRFKYNTATATATKIMSDVFLPEYLELPVVGGRQRYRLYGVVIHSGYTSDGGHYYTWIRSGHWWRP